MTVVPNPSSRLSSRLRRFARMLYPNVAGMATLSAAAVATSASATPGATAAALSVAIPATFGYNILANRLNRLDNLLEGFGTTVIALLVREGRI